jgi:hypothetical protein
MFDLVLQSTTPKQLVASLPVSPPQPSSASASSSTSSSASLAAPSGEFHHAASSSSSSSSSLNDHDQECCRQLPPLPPRVSLLSQLALEDMMMQPHPRRKNAAFSRHSNFGGMLVVHGMMGRRSILTDFTKSGDAVIPQVGKI